MSTDDLNEADPLADIHTVDEVRRASAARFNRVSRAIGWITIPLFILGVSLKALPIIIQLKEDGRKREDEQKKEQKKLDRAVEETREAVRQGKTGEAINRLFPKEHQDFQDRKKAEEVKAVDQ